MLKSYYTLDIAQDETGNTLVVVVQERTDTKNLYCCRTCHQQPVASLQQGSPGTLNLPLQADHGV